MSASAAALVSNLGQTKAGTDITTTSVLPAQGFTTGAHSAGYTLTGIEAALDASPNAAQRATVRAELWSAAAGGAPDSKIADLTVPSSVSAGTVSFAAPADTTLQASTTYYFLLYTTGTFDLRLDGTTSNAEDAGAAAGWSIANYARYLTMNTPGTGTPSWITDLNIAIRVNGAAIISPPLSADRAPREGGGDVTVTATRDPGGDNTGGGGPGGSGPGGDRPSGTGGPSGAGVGPASATHGAAALSTRIVGRRARSIDSPHCFVPGADELDTLGESARLAYRLDSAQDFDLCLWAPDPNWRTAPAYASCSGAGGALPEYASPLEGPGREEISVERALDLMACVVPAGTASEGGAWQLRISPDNPGPENPE